MTLPLLFDVARAAGPLEIATGVGFFLVFAAVAYIAFRLLRKTVKLAFRLAVVGVILLIALIGSISIYWFGSGRTPGPRPSPTRSR